ncbi:phosphoesterase family-domain-containing protein [Myxozyma melibiosi]|uniref:Phosphoesterase family-domain-containing protein n=1 Tax=Myxozyma melibiosi TaxID=54550 RepID=A0ABR1EZ20_9ASCO
MKYGAPLAALAALVAPLAAAAAVSSSSADPTPVYTTIEPSLSEIEAAAATAVVGEETSDVDGLYFKRMFVIWLENTDFEAADTQADLEWLAQYGVKLTNYFSVTHPSEPNYLAAVAGDYFGMDSDAFFQIPKNVSSIVDLLDSKNISWAEYQEHQPYAGYQGFNYSNQETYANDYVRKHNPLILFENIVNNASRLDNIKNFTSFYDDLDNEQLPQWAFITPNMTNDGHDSTIDVSGAWSRSFLEPLLNNSYFMEDTLVLLTFDENENYAIQNRVYALLLGGAVPEALQGTEDDTFYNHYSEIATVEANWDLPHLGRGDFDANVFALVAGDLSIASSEIDYSNIYNNKSAPGYYNDDTIPIPPPNVDVTNRNGQSILPAIKSVWGEKYASYTAESFTYSTETDNFASSTGAFTASSVTETASATSDASSGSASATSAAASSSSVAASSSTAASSSSSAGAAFGAAPATGLVGLVLAALAMI